MSEIQSSESTKAPWHLWVIGVLTLLWNAMGAFDYLMTQTQNEAYMSEFTPEQLEFFYNFPTWMVAFWALAVWVAYSVQSFYSFAKDGLFRYFWSRSVLWL